MQKWNGKMKAVTFSFDDGTIQDVRLVELLNKYGLKATFNLNSGYLGVRGQEPWRGYVGFDHVSASMVKTLYDGHEVAVHTLTHCALTQQNEETIIRQIEEDRKALEALCGYDVVGMAYPWGAGQEPVTGIVRAYTPIQYARTAAQTLDFSVQRENLLMWNPTIYWISERLEEVVNHFLEIQSNELQLLSIWGHSYELDENLETIDWVKIEKIFQKISGQADIFYGTNREVLL